MSKLVRGLNSDVTYAILPFLAILFYLLAIAGCTANTKNNNTAIQTKIDIYHHFTVYSENIEGYIFVTEIDTDDTIPVACDGWNKDDDNGHNCVLAGTDSILEMINLYNLPYTAIKGE